MGEKRFRYYEHKGADYILDNPNTELDFIEMLGDCLEAEEIVDLLNKLSDEIEQLKKERLTWLKSQEELECLSEENEQLKQSLSNKMDSDAYWEQKAKQRVKKLETENKQLKKELNSYKPLIFESEKGYVTLYEKKNGDKDDN